MSEAVSRSGSCTRFIASHSDQDVVQAAAEEVAREHPDGIDFLIVNAAVSDSQHKSGIATCV